MAPHEAAKLLVGWAENANTIGCIENTNSRKLHGRIDVLNAMRNKRLRTKLAPHEAAKLLVGWAENANTIGCIENTNTKKLHGRIAHIAKSLLK